MNNNWNIINQVYLYLSYDGSKVSIANPESKKYYGPVKKISESVLPPLTQQNEGFKVKIDKGNIYLEVEGKFRKIKNLTDKENILEQLSGASFENGVSKDALFGFSSSDPGKAIIIFNGTDLYKSAEEEYLRKVLLGLHTKTTKFKPGYRYENEFGKFWFLGTYTTWRKISSSYYRPDYKFSYSTTGEVEEKTIHAFSNYLPSSKNISDIFLNSEVMAVNKLDGYSIEDYPESILILDKPGSMVECDSELNLDIKLEESFQPRLEKFMKENKEEVTYESKYYSYRNVEKAFSIFDIRPYPNSPLSKSIDQQSLEKIKENIMDIIKTNAYICLYNFYNSGYNALGTDSDEETKIRELTSLYIKYFMKGNERGAVIYGQGSYFPYIGAILKYDYNIDVEKLLMDSLKEFEKDPKFEQFLDFQDYIDNIGYFRYKLPDNFSKTIDFLYTSSSNRKLSKFISEGEFKDLIAKIYKEAIDTLGSNLEQFEVIRVGTSIQKPVLRYEFKITLKDIMNNLGVDNLMDIPDEIKKELMSLKIYEINFITRSDLSPIL